MHASWPSSWRPSRSWRSPAAPAGRSTNGSPRSIRRQATALISSFRSARTMTPHVFRALVLRRWHAGRGVLVWRAGGAPSYRDRGRRPASPVDRRGRHHHRRVGRKLHGTRVRPLRRSVVLRVRGAVPQARRGGRAACAHPQPAQLAEIRRGQRRTFGARRGVLRRNPVRECNLWRPTQQERASRNCDRDRPIDRIASRVSRTTSTCSART